MYDDTKDKGRFGDKFSDYYLAPSLWVPGWYTNLSSPVSLHNNAKRLWFSEMLRSDV